MSAVAKDVISILKQAGVPVPQEKAIPATRKKKKVAKKKKAKRRTKIPHPGFLFPEDKVPDDYIRPDWAEYGFEVWPKTSRPIVAMEGPAGTSKTVTAFAMAAEMQAIVLHHQCKPDETATQLVGVPGIRPKNGGVEDYMRWGPLSLAAHVLNALQQEGKDTPVVVYFNEVNLWSPSNCVALNSVGDDIQAFYCPYTQERIECRGLRIMLDFNSGYTGTREMNEALKDRLHTMHSTYLKREQEIDLLLSRTAVSHPMAEKLIDALNGIRATSAEQGGAVRLDASLRLALDAAECIEHGMDEDRAWQEALYGRIGYEPRHREERKTLADISEAHGFRIEVA